MLEQPKVGLECGEQGKKSPESLWGDRQKLVPVETYDSELGFILKGKEFTRGAICPYFDSLKITL